MGKKQRKFADDGWAVWIDGDDTSTIYINDWINPGSKSHVDIAVRIRGVKASTKLYVYVPFDVSCDEIEDVSLLFEDRNILKAIFNSSCIVDYKKNEYTSEIAYNGKTVDILHISALEHTAEPLADGTLISVELEKAQQFIDNDEAYLVWRMPHKTLDEIFELRVNMEHLMKRFWALVTSPVIAEKYSYSIRINESRLLPEAITRKSEFRRQKLKKAVVNISIDEDYELNDGDCYRIRRLEENLYREYIPEKYKCDGAIMYQWNQNRDYDSRGRFNFYYNITKTSVSRGSMFLYLVLFVALGVAGTFVSDGIRMLFDLLK